MTIIVIQTYNSLSKIDNIAEEQNALLIIAVGMTVSTIISFVPRIVSLVGIFQLMMIPANKYVEHDEYPQAIIDFDGVIPAILKRFGLELLDKLPLDFDDKPIDTGDLKGPFLVNRNIVISRIYFNAENMFVSLLYPPEAN